MSSEAHLGRGVDNRDHLPQIAGYQAVIQDPILIFETLQELVLPDGCIHGVELVIRPTALLVESVDLEGQPANETELPAFLHGECSALVETWVV